MPALLHLLGIFSEGKLMLRLLFVCQCQSMHSDAQIDGIQKDGWRRCAKKKLGGFMVRSDRNLVGLFEGPEKTVVGQIEHLIRKHKVDSVDVMYEASVQTRGWPAWITQFETLDDVPAASTFDLGGLAQNVMDAVEAGQRNN